MTEALVTIVDDDEAVRDSLALLLNFRGYRTQAYASAEACLHAWRADWRGCLLLDLRMGGMDGLALQQALIQRGSTLPIVFLTGHGDLAHARAALKSGAVDFLEKPYEEADLLKAVSEALERDTREYAVQAHVAEIAAHIERLSERERQVMDLVVAGKPNREIAEELGISPRTVEVFKARMMEKMQARSVPELVRMAMDAGMLK
ncbi:MAG: DNA-binding response regulator [Hydrogenophilales bacterium 28-61-23]|nr:MAG: DNA-binding response regulator [Hydrogenophilales bacterium 28-61-23]